jgi:hypothetical protein
MVDMDMKIDLLMIGVVRPAIIEETTISLIENVLNDNHEYRMIANIDPVGERKHTQQDCVNVLKKYFDVVIANKPKEPSVVDAWKWVIEQSDTEFMWFKEDDIKILRKVDLDDMIRILQKNPKLSMLMTDKWGAVLSHKKTIDKNTILRSAMHFKYTGDNWYKAPNWYRAAGITSTLVKRAFLKPAAKWMIQGNSPNNSIKGKRNDGIQPFIKKWNYGYYQQPGGEKHFIDLGKGWKRSQGFTKPIGGVWKTWKKVK